MRYNLLIVDDVELDRLALRLLIKKEFPEIRVLPDARNGIEFIQMVETESIDIAIVDIEMPGLDGIAALKYIRKENDQIAVIINTAYSKFDYALDAIKVQAIDFILKPMNREITIAAINKCIEYLHAAKSQSDRDSQIDRMVTELMPAFLDEFVRAVATNHLNQSNLSLYTSLVRNFNDENCVLYINNKTFHQTDVAMSTHTARICQSIHTFIKDICEGVAGQYGEDGIIVVLSQKNSSVLAQSKWTLGVAEYIQKKSSFVCQTDIFIGIGSIVSSPLDLYESYCKASTALRQCDGDHTIVSYDEVYAAPTDDVNKIIKQAQEYIRDNFIKDISLGELADTLQVSKFYLSRLFKQELGINFMDYLTDLRMERAKKLISTENYSIRALAGQVGYQNHTYFCKIFKKHTGMTVGEYRKIC